MWEVSQADSGTRLVDFIKKQLLGSLSGTQVKRLIEANLCTVNGRTERFASFCVGRGDSIILMQKHLPSSPSPDLLPDCLYEDEHLFAYNKPAGVAVEQLPLSKISKDPLRLVHRLDRDTTGVLLMAKTSAMQKELENLFRIRHSMKKEYIAIVDGVMEQESGLIHNRLKIKCRYQGQLMVGEAKKNEEGQLAITEWNCEKRGEATSLVYCFPQTGRTHQLRAHFYELGHPILGDYHYGRSWRSKYRPTRHLLHAKSIQFHHPFTAVLCKIEAPLPQDFVAAIKQLF